MEEIKQRLEAAREVKEKLQALGKCPGWGLLVELITEGREMRRKEIGEGPILSMEQALDRNFKLGIIAGMQFPIVAAKTREELADEETSQLLELLREGNTK